jgi:hypothetical protein
MLSFADTKKLDSRITFVRTTTGVFYDGKTTAKAEENLLLRSQEFDDAYWNKTTTTITANSTTAPDGTSTADTFAHTSSSGSQIFKGPSPAFNGTPYTLSVFFKYSACQWVRLTMGSVDVWFDVQNGVVGTQSGGTGSIVNAGGGWYRCVVVASPASGSIAIANTAADNSSTRSTDANFLWGAQLEQRSAVTAYTPTTTQPITNYVPVLLTAAAGQPRFDHNPTTDESLGLLIEEQRTNLLLRSEEFDNAYWEKTNVSASANQIIAPDGTLTADLITENTASGFHVAQRAFTTSAVIYSLTIFAKAGGRNWLQLRIYDGTNLHAGFFNLATGAVGTVTSGVVATITPAGNGWYRCSVTSPSAVLASASGYMQYALGSSDNTPNYTGNGVSGLYIWGAQLEAGAFPTSYIKTEGSTVTRNADAASMTSSNFSSWFSNAEGTLYTEINPRALAVSSGVQVNDNSTSNRIRLATTSISDQGTVTTSGTAQATLDGGTPAANTNMKLAMSYKFNDFALSLNGGTVATDTSGTVPVVNQLQIGAETTAVGNLNIKKIAYYPKALSDAEKQALTTS